MHAHVYRLFTWKGITVRIAGSKKIEKGEKEVIRSASTMVPWWPGRLGGERECAR